MKRPAPSGQAILPSSALKVCEELPRHLLQLAELMPLLLPLANQAVVILASEVEAMPRGVLPALLAHLALVALLVARLKVESVVVAVELGAAEAAAGRCLRLA